MKIRTIRYIVREGVLNAYRNKLMSLASIGIVAASLLIFGIFYLMIMNLNRNTEVLHDIPEMEVFCDYELNDQQVTEVENAIKNCGMVKKYTKVTKQQALEKLKGMLGSDALLEEEDGSFLPVTFIVELLEPDKSSEVVDQFRQIEGVDSVTYSKDTIDMILSITHWVRWVSIFLIGILLVISVFIISNTIRLTVFARRKEINIMKYIGATDSFIRWPFVIEGVIIGLVGSLVAFLFTSYGYNALEHEVTKSLDIIKLARIGEVSLKLVLYFSLIGIIVGAMGSIMSIRKYLHV